MKTSAYLNISKIIVLVLGMQTSVVSADFLPDELQFHGFLTQGFFHTSDNNLYGQSDDGISPGLTEVGLNTAYQPFSKLRFAAQGLYRRAGGLDHGSVRLDYGLADLTLLSYDSGQIGLRGGRIKVPYGLYNETRDVSFTHPTILLPQPVYFDQSRSLMVSADGGSFYADQRTAFGDFHFKFNYGMTLDDNSELRVATLGAMAQGRFTARPAIATQLSYELNGGEYVFAVSYLDLMLDYHPMQGEPLSSGTTYIQPLLFSAQYNGEKFTLTGEYDYRRYTMKDYGMYLPNFNLIANSWYLQGSYQILPQVQTTVRYEEFHIDMQTVGQVPFVPGATKQLPYAHTWVAGVRWDITPSWMLRAEYQRVDGSAWLPDTDNHDRSMVKPNWDIYALQLSFRF